jgi:hypothetical protein
MCRKPIKMPVAALPGCFVVFLASNPTHRHVVDGDLHAVAECSGQDSAGRLRVCLGSRASSWNWDPLFISKLTKFRSYPFLIGSSGLQNRTSHES